MKARLVLFDLDGTLADTAADIARATNLALAEAGRPPLTLAQVRALVSSGARALLRAGFVEPPEKKLLEQLLERLFAIYSETLVRETKPFPGLTELIAEIAAEGVPWGVVTNKPVALARPIVAALGIAPPPLCVIGGDSLPRKKPDPLPLIQACREAEVAPGAAIYVGDAEIDARAARAARMPLVVAGFGYAPDPEATRAWGVVRYAKSAEELAQILGLRDRIFPGAL